MTERQKFAVRTRDVWFTLADWRAFSDALVEAYPQARYDIRPTHNVGPDYPGTIWDRHLMDVPFNRETMLAWDDNVLMVFNPDWMPEYETFRLPADPPDIVRWKEKPGRSRMPFAQFRRRTSPTPSQLATMTRFDHSEIYCFCEAGNKMAEAETRRFLRLLNKFCTNRNQAYYWLEPFDGPGCEYRRTEAKGSWFWLGHDAIRWASEDPRRIMRYHGTTGIRPCTEEEMAALAAQTSPVQQP
jgi:hypothetical protein